MDSPCPTYQALRAEIEKQKLEKKMALQAAAQVQKNKDRAKDILLAIQVKLAQRPIPGK